MPSITESSRVVPSVYVRFETRPVEDPVASEREGRAVFVDKDWIIWTKKGTSGATNEDLVARVRKHNPAIWSVAESLYESWKKGQDEPVTGMPLREWPQIGRSRAEELIRLNLRTVEDLAAATDADLERMGMGARDLRDKARAWLAAAADTGKTAERMAALERENDELRASVGELRETVAALAKEGQKRTKPGDVAKKAA